MSFDEEDDHYMSKADFAQMCDEIKTLQLKNAELKRQLEEAKRVHEWKPIATAPKNGSMVWLALADDDERSNAFEDTEGLVRTLGFNSFDQTGDDRWDMAGWDWCGDRFTQGSGTPLYWKEIDWFNLPPAAPTTDQPEE